MAEWAAELIYPYHNAVVIKLTAEFDLRKGWQLHDIRYMKPEIRQNTRRMKLGIDWVKIDSMFKVMRRGIFKYEIYTVPGHLERDTAKLLKAAKT